LNHVIGILLQDIKKVNRKLKKINNGINPAEGWLVRAEGGAKNMTQRFSQIHAVSTLSHISLG
jgi:hypothetical protein